MAKDYKISVVIDGKDNASKVLEKFSGAATKWLKIATAAAVAAAIAFGAASMKWGMDFESQMSSVEAVSRATVGEMAALNEKAKQLGRDSAFSATESGKAMEFLAMAGLKPGQVLAAVGDTLNLAAAGSLDLAEAADIASNVLTGFNLAAENMGRVSDVMAETAASANTNVQQLGNAMSYVAPVASAAGWSLEATAAAIGMLGNAGIQGSMAGTVLRQAIMALLNPTDAASQALSNLGISITDNQGRMLSLEEILRQIDPAVLDTAEGLGDLAKIFGTRATPGITALIKQGADNLGEFTNQLNNAAGAAETMAETKLDNLKGAFTLLRSSVEGVGIALVTGGEKSVLGSMKSFITEGLIPVVNRTAEWIAQVGGLPGMLKLAWDILTMFVKDLGTLFKNFFTDWDFVKLLGKNFAIVLGGLLLSIAQFLGKTILAVGTAAKDLWTPLAIPFVVVMSQLKELFLRFLNWIGPKVIETANFLIEPFRWVLDKIGIEIGDFNWEPLTVEPALKMEEVWPAVWTNIKNNGVEALNIMKDAAIDFGDNMKVAGDIMLDTFAAGGLDIENFGKKVDDLIDKQKRLGMVAAETGKELIEPIEALPPAADDASKHLGPGERLWNAMKLMGKHTTQCLKGGWQQYLAAMPKFIDKVEADIAHMGLVIQRGLASEFEIFLRTGSFSIKNITEDITNYWRKFLSDIAADALMRFVVGPAIEWLIGKLGELFGIAKNPPTKEQMWGWCSGIPGASWNAIAASVSFLVGSFLQIFGIFNTVPSTARMWGWCRGIPGAGWNAIAASVSFLAGSFSQIFEIFNTVPSTARMWGWCSGLPGPNENGIVRSVNFLVGNFAQIFGIFNTVPSTARMWGWCTGLPGAGWNAIVASVNFLAGNFAQIFGIFNNAPSTARMWGWCRGIPGANWNAIYNSVADIIGLFNQLYGTIYNAPPNMWEGVTTAAKLAAASSAAPLEITYTSEGEMRVGGLEAASYAHLYDIYQKGGLFGLIHGKGGRLPQIVYDFLYWLADEKDYANWSVAMYYVMQWEKSKTNALWNQFLGAQGYPTEYPLFHSGGMISGEGMFLGLRGEGVLNRSAMGILGESGLDQLNQGRVPVTVNKIIIQGWDGEDIKRVILDDVIPILNEMSEAGVDVIHERGIKHEVA